MQHIPRESPSNYTGMFGNSQRTSEEKLTRIPQLLDCNRNRELRLTARWVPLHLALLTHFISEDSLVASDRKPNAMLLKQNRTRVRQGNALIRLTTGCGSSSSVQCHQSNSHSLWVGFSSHRLSHGCQEIQILRLHKHTASQLQVQHKGSFYNRSNRIHALLSVVRNEPCAPPVQWRRQFSDLSG